MKYFFTIHKCLAKDTSILSDVTLCEKALSESDPSAACMAVKRTNASDGFVCDYRKALEATVSDCVIHRNQDSNIFLDLAILCGTIFLFVGALSTNKWKMTVRLGKNLIVIYVVYLAIQALNQFVLKGCQQPSCCKADEYFCHVNKSCISTCSKCSGFTTNPSDFRSFCMQG